MFLKEVREMGGISSPVAHEARNSAGATSSSSLLAVAQPPPCVGAVMWTHLWFGAATSASKAVIAMDKQEQQTRPADFLLPGPEPSPETASLLHPQTSRPTIAHRVSLSPDASSSEEEESSPQQVRKSTRTKTSTVIYVDGHAIKKDNNYVLKGGQYVFGGLVEATKPEHHQRSQKKTTSTVAKAPRKVTAAEQERLEKKTALEAAIAQKAVLRKSFLKMHVHCFKPFLEPKVLDRIQAYNESLYEISSVFMQPDAIKADLRDYQLAALNWMSSMYQRNVGMILGDEMGLGKTLQTIALVCHIKEAFHVSGPSLVLSPLSVLDSWSNEIKKWAPTLKFVRLHSSNPESLDTSNLANYDIVVTTYEMAKAPVLRHLWSRQQFNLLVLDEGHRIKSAETQISQAVRRIHCENRLMLTGTPLANNLVEMWSLLNFLVPDVFTTSEPFAEAFDLTHNRVDPGRLEDAHRLLKVFMLRRLKTEVEKLMPQKIETKVVCPLSNSQIWWYKAILLKDMNLLAKSDSKCVSRAQLLNNLIMQLRKVCLHPYLFPEAEDIDSTTLKDLVGSSGKLTVLDKLLCSLYEKGHRVCLFSQFTSVLDILDDYCSMRGWKYCRFDGGTARAKRNYVINSFNAPNSDKFLFLMSTRSGGMGLNLQTADTCILFDSDWNPQPDIQAMARVHRIGQTKTVHVYRLITEGTVEQRMVERAEKKLYLEKMVTRDGASKSEVEDVEDVDKLVSTLKFGCNAVFGEGSNTLPTEEDIALITDRKRTDNFTAGKLHGAADASAKDYDATKQLTSSTDFGGIDFKKIRDEYARSKKPGSMREIRAMWQEKKRERKSRIVLVESKNSGWGSKSVPVLASNDYDLESGERSVFARELQGHYQTAVKKTKKNQPSFESQDHCQVCGLGGHLLCCPRCPVALHVQCSGVGHEKHFLCCSHHHCSVCEKPAASVGGFMFPCSSCVNCYCEDHLPAGARYLEDFNRMDELGFQLKNGVYIHCSAACEQVAIKEYGYKVPGPKQKDPCPPNLDLAEYFGGKVDDNFEAPDNVMIGNKRRRERVNY